MREVGEYVLYRKDVCKIADKRENAFTGAVCYSLIPISDETLKMTVPVDNKYIKDLMSKTDIENLLKKIKDIPIIESEDKLLENEYKRLLNEGNQEDLVRIIKTTYLRNQKRINNNKKISDKDTRYFEMAENYLYQEIGTVLNMTKEEAKDYIIKNIEGA